ncbi:MAG: redoxin domain-containing protein [Phycisphaerae bacterium]|nr:redoxin domain-containing protein [Phycisphaerae bacterium]
MRTTLRTIATVLLVALVATTAAQQRPKKPVIGEMAPEIKLTKRRGDKEGDSLLERYRERILVLFFFRSDDSASVEAIPLLNKIHKDLGKKGVVIIGISTEKTKNVESFAKGKEVEFLCYTGAEGIQHMYYVSAFPRVYLIDTGGILVDHFHPLDDLEEKILTQIRKTPPLGADPATLGKRLAQARGALSGKKYGKAYTYAKDVNILAEKGSDLEEQSGELIEQIEEAAEEWLQEARQAARKKEYEEACRILAELSIRFEGTEIGDDADKEISRLMGDRELKPKLNKAKDNARGEWINDEAAELLAGKRYLEAIKRYREVIELYPDTNAAQAAEKEVDRVNEDPKAQKRIAELRAEEEADRWLDIGDRYARIKLYNQAREYYERVRAEHPTSPAASKAKQRLDDLPEDDPEEDGELAEELKEADKEDTKKG